MNKILPAGAILLALINAPVPASAAAPKHATRYQQAPVQQQWFGSGAPIAGVDADSPAAKAGLRPGDVIVGINGRPINNQSDVDPFLAGSGGHPLALDVNRGGTLVRLRATPQQGKLGYSYWTLCFFCSTDDPGPPPPPIPDPPIPTPPVIIPPPITN